MPIIIIIGIINTIISLTIQGFSMFPLIVTIVVIMLNLIVTALTLEFKYIKYFISFLISIPIFNIYIPIYSIFNMDDLKWGLTRDNTTSETV